MAEGKKPGVPHTPRWASACCCSGIVNIVAITTTPSAATMAIIAIEVVFSSCEWWFMLAKRKISFY
jgi:hypothetical protein